MISNSIYKGASFCLFLLLFVSFQSNAQIDLKPVPASIMERSKAFEKIQHKPLIHELDGDIQTFNVSREVNKAAFFTLDKPIHAA